MTTVLQQQLVAPLLLAAADGTVYTVPAQTTAKIGRAVFTNTTASVVSITAGITTGGSLGPANTMISARSVAPGESYVSPELSGVVLPANSVIRAYASAANAIGFTASGLTMQ